MAAWSAGARTVRCSERCEMGCIKYCAAHYLVFEEEFDRTGGVRGKGDGCLYFGSTSLLGISAPLRAARGNVRRGFFMFTVHHEKVGWNALRPGYKCWSTQHTVSKK